MEELEPAPGFEPGTDGLQNRSSTTELSWPIHYFNSNNNSHDFGKNNPIFEYFLKVPEKTKK